MKRVIDSMTFRLVECVKRVSKFNIRSITIGMITRGAGYVPSSPADTYIHNKCDIIAVINHKIQ